MQRRRRGRGRTTANLEHLGGIEIGHGCKRSIRLALRMPSGLLPVDAGRGSDVHCSSTTLVAAARHLGRRYENVCSAVAVTVAGVNACGEGWFVGLKDDGGKLGAAVDDAHAAVALRYDDVLERVACVRRVTCDV